MGFTVAGVSAITAASLAATAASAGVGVAGAISSSQAQAANARYQSQIARNNAVTATNNAALAGQQAGVRAQADDRATATRLGAQRAAMGADGGQLGSGSALNVQRDTSNQGALAASQDIYQGQLAGYGYETQAGNFTAQSQLDTAEASQASTAGMIGAGSSLLSGASQFSSKWNQYYGGNTGTTVDPSWDSATQGGG